MRSPRWARWLLGRLAPKARADEVVGDLEEAHRLRQRRLGRVRAMLGTTVEAVDVALALVRGRVVDRSVVSWLDVKLAGRVLVRYPGLTLLGGLSMAFAIVVGAATFELATKAVDPHIPLPNGDRIVGLQIWDASTSDPESRVLYDAESWRRELRTVEDVTVYRTRAENLIVDEVGTPVVVAEMWPSGFDLAGVPAFLGRVLTAEDQAPGAPAVAVVGFDTWADRLGGDPDVLGREVRIGDAVATVVGVMPEGFAFPIDHDLWVAFPASEVAYQPLDGPRVRVLGRRAADASPADARAELALAGQRMAAAFPATHQHLQPQIRSLAQTAIGLPSDTMWLLFRAVGLSSNLPVLLFLLLVCGNVALLMFARASARESELVVRSALGASRARLVAQLFVEALALAAVAALVGLFVARYAVEWALWIVRLQFFEGAGLPFWLDAGISPRTVAYTAVLAVVAAMVAGAWPGLRVTRDLGDRLKQDTAGGGGFRFGGVWTVVVAGQVLLMMLFPLVTLAVRGEGSVELDYDPPFHLDQYLVGWVPPGPIDPRTDDPPPAPGGTVAQTLRERLLAEPGVVGVAIAERLPMTYHPWNQIEIDGPSATPRDERGHRVGSGRVGLAFFDVMGADLVAGRGFQAADLAEGARAVVVDDAFVDRVLGGRNATGVHLRYLAGESYRDPDQEPGPWLEIVGVVEEIGARSFYGAGGIYHPVVPDSLPAAHLIAHVPAGAAGLAGRLRALATEVDPARPLLRVSDLVEATRGPRDFYAFWTTLLVFVSAFALVLSMATIYAVMSYTVARRTREIGIRVALGADRRRVVTAVFRRPLGQVGLGLGAGTLVLALLFIPGIGGLAAGRAARVAAMLVGYVVLTGLVCAAACAWPTLRALRVEPQEALRIDG